MRIPTRLLSLIPVLLAAGGWSFLSAQNLVTDKSSLSFSAQFGGGAVSQQLTITSSTGAAIPFSIFSSTLQSPQWLKINGQLSFAGNTPATVTVTADPTGLSLGPISGSLLLTTPANSTQTNLPVNLTISPISANPSSVTFPSYTQGGAIPTAQSITLTGSGTFTAAASTQTGGQWLSVIPSNGAAPGAITAQLNPSVVSGLAVGTYQGTIALVVSPGAITINIPVTLTVLPTPPVSVNPASLTFNVQQGGTNNIATQTLTITTTPGQSLTFALQGSYPASVPNWLTFNPPVGNTDPATGTAQVTIGYNLTGLTVGNTYTATLILSTPGGTPVSTNVPVTLIYSANQLLNVPTNTLNFVYQLGAPAPAAKTVSVTATSGNLSYSISQSANSPWLVVPNAGNTGTPFSVSVNPSGLTPGTYTATISVTSATPGSTPQQIPVVLKVTNDPMIATNVSAMTFPFQVGQQAPAAQTLKITSTTGVPLNFTVTPSVTNCGSNWLLLNGGVSAVSGTTDGTISVGISTTGFTAGTCTGTINVAATIASTGAAAVNSPVQIPVTVVVATTPLLVAAPASLSFSAPVNAASPVPQTIALSSTSPAQADVLSYQITSVSGTSSDGITWLFAGPTSGTTANNNVISVNVFSSTLKPGTYNGTVTIAATQGSTAVANSPLTIPVTLTVTSGSLTLSATSASFSYTIGGPNPATQTVTVGSSTSTPLIFTAVANTTTPTPWLSVTPTSGNTSSSGTLTISVDGSKLTTPGTYNGSITVTSPGAGNSPATINVTVTVSPGTISAPTATLSFTQAAGGPAPAAQTVNITGSPAPLNFTAAASTTPSGGTWLSVTPTSGTTPGTISVSANGSGLTVGQYAGQVTITSTGANGSPITIPVVLNVIQPATATATPSSLTFNYTTGLTVPPAQTLTINSATTIPITASVQTTTASGWLALNSTQGNAPGTFLVSVQPTNLAAGNYTGSITISSPNLINNLTVPVTLIVTTIPKPVITAIANAASYATGPVSPGENIVLFGTGIGPADLAKNGVTNNAFGTSVGNTRVLFDGIAAPILYASATQTSVMVPYEVFGRAATSVVVEFSGVQSNPISLSVAGSMPGIYTLNQAGTGPGAILNQDGLTVNGGNTPEKRGNIISVYMTGEGQTTPPGVSGAIIPALVTALKNPILPVTATIGGLPALVNYAGSAAGLVSGVMQVNLTIPQGVTPGSSVPIVITVGTVSSQTGVTVAVQ